jgi:hypothetical protein
MLTRLSSCRLNILFTLTLLLGFAAFQFPWAGLQEQVIADDHDQEILTFSSVGDSRQDPVTFDPTTAPLSGQDAIWLQNTKAQFTSFLSVGLQVRKDSRGEQLFRSNVRCPTGIVGLKQSESHLFYHSGPRFQLL